MRTDLLLILLLSSLKSLEAWKDVLVVVVMLYWMDLVHQAWIISVLWHQFTYMISTSTEEASC
jgi:hypothetical protein